MEENKIKGWIFAIGKKGIDDWAFKFPDGRTEPWKTDEEMEVLNKLYPMPPQEEIERIKREAEEYINRKRS
jgi:hypothetical protein